MKKLIETEGFTENEHHVIDDLAEELKGIKHTEWTKPNVT
jgi:hypothetical protein